MTVSTFVYTDEKKELLKKTICKGSSDDELELFGHICRHTGLDPFMRQIYPVFRKERNSDGSYSNKMTVQTSIDGFRLIAERTGNYSPGKESTFTYDDKKNIVSATSYVKKRTSDGIWHDIAATAFFSEYAQTYTDKSTGNKKPTQFWEKMPHVMLSKCAEALALRKAFPAELSGIYTADEMAQAHKVEAVELPKEKTEITEEEWGKLDLLVQSINDEEYIKKLAAFVDAPTLWDIAPKDYDRVMKSLSKNAKDRGVVHESTDVA